MTHNEQTKKITFYNIRRKEIFKVLNWTKKVFFIVLKVNFICIWFDFIVKGPYCLKEYLNLEHSHAHFYGDKETLLKRTTLFYWSYE